MNLKALLLFVLILGGCAREPQNSEGWMARERNACLPAAIAMAQGLRRQGVEAKVVRYDYRRKGRLVGHAVTAYLYPPGANQLWTYDFEGSWRTWAYWQDPMGIARAAERLRGRETEVLCAEVLP